MAGREKKAAVPWGENTVEGTTSAVSVSAPALPEAQAARVRFSPRPPAEVVYLQPVEAKEHSRPIEDVGAVKAAHPPGRLTRLASRSVRIIPLFWTALLALAALQHAAETDRRIAIRESAETKVDVQTRTAREIRAAWRDIAPEQPTIVPRDEEASRPVSSSQIAALNEPAAAASDAGVKEPASATVDRQEPRTDSETAARSETPAQPLVEMPTPASQAVDREQAGSAPEKQQGEASKPNASETPAVTPAIRDDDDEREPTVGSRRQRAVPRLYRVAQRAARDEFNPRYITVERVGRICP